MVKSNRNRIYKDVQVLTSIVPARNFQNLESLEKIKTYIKKEFEKLQLLVEEQKWMAEGNEYTNVIASYNKEKTKRLIVGAHYDVCGDQTGADDNSSAVAGLLETARLIAELKPSLDYRIDFVAFCLEEPPFFGTDLMGSFVHAKSLKDNKIDVLGMICFEMIGYFSDESDSQTYPSPELAMLYPNKANFIIVVGIDQYSSFNNKIYNLMSKNSAIDVQLISFPTAVSLAGMSDHFNYWHFGYKAVMINDTAFIRNPNYHEKSDTIDTLDFTKMAYVIESSYRAITNIH